MTSARGATRPRRWARRVSRALLAVIALFGLLLAAGLTRNYLRSTTRGTVPLEVLARRGSRLEREVALAVADSLKTGPQPGAWKWYAARTTSANGDTIRFRIYRARDARLPGRLVRPDPHITGGARYIVSERRFERLGIGVR